MTELLAPAGDLEKLKVACLYGADAVYIGGKSFSLRSRASNFGIEDIKEGVSFAHALSKKVYVTTNIIPHDDDLEGLVPYLKALESAGVDAIIAASPSIIRTARAHTGLEIHLSTQQSVMHSASVAWFKSIGVSRVVLARELSKETIRDLAKSSPIDLEVFIHGGMCMSISGRCALSDHLTGRDANRGGCAHSCRWTYTLQKGGVSLSDEPFSMSSRDLEALASIPDLVKAGVHSLKIEGRMKSLHYIATVVRTYREAIDAAIQDGHYPLDKLRKSLQKAENRLTGPGFLEGFPGPEAQLFGNLGEQPSQTFIGIIRAYDPKTGKAMIEQRNKFVTGTEAEVFNPDGTRSVFSIGTITSEDGTVVESAPHPRQMLEIDMPVHTMPYALLRRTG
jgi:U32 family peptidase